LQDFIRCLEFAIDTALAREVDAVLFAGDAYKVATPSPTQAKPATRSTMRTARESWSCAGGLRLAGLECGP
jgi:DNA repair exonuclease SbcCD nuclease subunit